MMFLGQGTPRRFLPGPLITSTGYQPYHSPEWCGVLRTICIRFYKMRKLAQISEPQALEMLFAGCSPKVQPHLSGLPHNQIYPELNVATLRHAVQIHLLLTPQNQPNLQKLIFNVHRPKTPYRGDYRAANSIRFVCFSHGVAPRYGLLATWRKLEGASNRY